MTDSKPTSRRERWVRMADVGGRVLLGAICVVLAVNLLWPFISKAMREEPAEAKSDTPAMLPPPLSMTAFDEGHWRFRDLDWQVRMSPVAYDDVDRKLTETPNIEVIETPRGGMAGDEVIALLRKLGAKPTQIGDHRALHLRLHGARIVVFLSSNDPTASQVALARIAYPADQGKWTLLEATPATEAPVGSEKRDTESTPTLGEGAQIICTRWDVSGRLLGQVGTVAGELPLLLKRWHDEGWVVELMPGSGDIADSPTAFVVSRGGTAFTGYAIRKADAHLLMLTRLSD